MARHKAEAKGRAARKAAKTSRAAGQAAVELRAAELATRVRESEPVARSQAKAQELAERVRDSDTVGKAQALTSELAGRVRDAKLDERATEVADRARTAVRDAKLDERATELADRARTAVRDAHLDQRAADLAARVRESDAAQRATEAARRTSDQTFERVGSWIVNSKTGERLGVAPARGRRFPVWLGLLLGLAAGYLAAKLTSRSRDVTPPHDDPFAEAADRLSAPAAPHAQDPDRPYAPAVEPPAGPAPSAMPSVQAAGSPLADEIRSSLDADPRTAGLPGLAINVADSTVFVRGSVPEGFDETSIREVVASVPGVTDVDLQVSPA